MAEARVKKSVEYLTFSGADTQTIAIASNYTALITFLDLSANGAVTISVLVGTTQVWKGWINTTPVQLNFGEGRGSSEAGNDISVIAGGACEVFVGLKQTLNT